MAAIFLPVLVFLFAARASRSAGSTPPRRPARASLGHPLVALVLLGVCVLSLFHWAQRFRYTLFDGLQIKAHQGVINLTVYTLAVVGSAAALAVLWQAVAARAG